METRLGVQLVKLHNRCVSLTPRARPACSMQQRILAEIDDMEKLVSAPWPHRKACCANATLGFWRSQIAPLGFQTLCEAPTGGCNPQPR